ncbi:MAG TPA: hypothetical protein VNM92_05935 [Thermoanaerobaculia bacterium]|nr:hypothetical protein [Thermoanaerobaculia bacterium]
MLFAEVDTEPLMVLGLTAGENYGEGFFLYRSSARLGRFRAEGPNIAAAGGAVRLYRHADAFFGT